MKSLAFTGHRYEKLYNILDNKFKLKSAIKYNLKHYINVALFNTFNFDPFIEELRKTDIVYNGLANGFDLQTLKYLIGCPKISGFDCIVGCKPFSNHDLYWEEEDKQKLKKYEKYITLKIFEEDSHKAWSSLNQRRSLYLKRDRYMVDQADNVISLLYPDIPSSGTMYTVKYAIDKGKKVKNLWRRFENEFMKICQLNTNQNRR